MRKKIFKRMISVAVTAAMLTASMIGFTGCGGSSSEGEKSE